MSYKNNFNILRLLAAFMVMVGHMYVLMGIAPRNILSSPIHEIGVFIFFLIGGYLVTKSYLSNSNILVYMVKRVFRILPALIAFVIFATFIVGPILSTLPVKEYLIHPVTKNYFLKNCFLSPAYTLPGVFETNQISSAVNGSLWTLPIEVMMYIVLPVLLNVTGVKQNRKYAKKIWFIITILVFIVGVVKRIYYPTSCLVIYGTDWALALNIIPYYFIGSMFAICVPKEIFDLQKAIVFFFFCILLGGNLVLDNILLAISLPYLVFSLAYAPEPVFSKVMQKHEISYGLYLYGFFVQQLLLYIFIAKLGMELSIVTYLVLSTVCTIVLAYLSATFVEEPFGKLSKKIIFKISTR